jgi:hypothetical protein
MTSTFKLALSALAGSEARVAAMSRSSSPTMARNDSNADPKSLGAATLPAPFAGVGLGVCENVLGSVDGGRAPK